MPDSDFEASLPRDEVTFRVPPDDFVYRCVAQVPAGAFLGTVVVSATRRDDVGLASVSSMVRFLDAALEGESRERFTVSLSSSSHPVSMDQILEIGCWLIEVYSGRPYGTSLAIAGWAVRNWGHLDGVLLRAGVDLHALPLARALNVLYAIMVEGADEKDRAKLDRQLDSAGQRAEVRRQRRGRRRAATPVTQEPVGAMSEAEMQRVMGWMSEHPAR